MPNYVNAMDIKLVSGVFASNMMRPDNTLTTIDLSHVEFENGNASNVFMFRQGLTSVLNFPNNVTNMYGTFAGCAYITDVPAIPNSVTDLSYTYASCYRLVNAPTIPNSVVNMTGSFQDCNLGLQNPPVIPDSVSTIASAFHTCVNLLTMPSIPNSVTNLHNAFYNCVNITTASNIPSSAIDVSGTFSHCQNLTGNIYFHSNQITNAVDCFNWCAGIKNVYIPFTYSNGVNTSTYNAFISAGYNTEGSGWVNVYLKDINASTGPHVH